MPRGVKVERPAPAESVEVSFNLSSLLLKLTLAGVKLKLHNTFRFDVIKWYPVN